jgi:TonB-linked SusC/RagA family outer membrane protein
MSFYASSRTTLLFIFFIALILPVSVFAQNTVITGKVTDPEGNPVQSVSVNVKGSSAGTTTKADGSFSLSFTKTGSDVLVFSSVGFTDKEITIGNNTEINAQLERNEQSLNNVVVVGYGTQKRKDVTGSVVTLDRKRLDNIPNSNVMQALEGAIAGVSINTNGGGAEGNNVSIVVRGKKSINGNQDPLIVLDDIPYRGSISDINPSDVASITILKDASALAIYGAESANGVILITTKKGSSGKPVISYEGFYGTQHYANLPPILMGDDFYNFKVTREPNSVTVSERALYNAKNYTNWLDLTTRTGQKIQHSLGVRGGGSNFKYYASVSFLNTKGVAVNDNFKRLSGRINLEANLTNWLTYGTNTSLGYDDRSGLSPTFSGDNGAYLFNPLTSPYDSTGRLTIYPWPEDTHFANPLAPTLALSSDHAYKIFTTNYLLVKIPFVKGLSYRLNTGIEYQGREIKSYYGRNTATGLQAGGSFSQSNSILNDYTIDNIVTYERSFKKHTIGFTGLYSYAENKTTSNSLTASNFPNDVLGFYQANVALLITPGASLQKETTISQMARLNYGYDSRYLLTITARRDGYSGFGENYKFAVFPSAAVAWNITNEKFFSPGLINNLKLRVSYGSNGNKAISPYQTLAKLSTRNYVDGAITAPGYVPTSFANPDLRWETSVQANVGLDFSLWKNRIQGSIDYYDTKTHDLLLNRNVSAVQGITTVTQNIGRTSNHGLELSLTSNNLQSKDFSWTSNITFSLNRNKILDLYGDKRSDTASQWFIGYPVDVRFGYQYAGVWQLTDDTAHTPQGAIRPGFAKVKDINGDGVINSYDRTIIGNIQPDFTWGFANTFQYRNFSLYIFAYGVAGRHEVNTLMSDNNVNAGVRYTTVVKNWWTRTNPTNDFYANVIGANSLSAGTVENSSFIRIRDISLSYDITGKVLQKMGLSKFRFYVETRNPFTITKWTGLDPEFTSQISVPLQREFVVGINVSL